MDILRAPEFAVEKIKPLFGAFMVFPENMYGVDCKVDGISWGGGMWLDIWCRVVNTPNTEECTWKNFTSYFSQPFGPLMMEEDLPGFPLLYECASTHLGGE